MKKITLPFFIFVLFFLNTANADVIPYNPQDPYENLNRHIFQMNDTLDRAFLKPVACFYNRFVPPPLRAGISNVFNNAAEIPTIINDVLQLKLLHTLQDTSRFFVNTTVGVGGVFDIASRGGLPQHCEDFGLTLARYGYKNSAYFVIPFLGPSTVRDAFAMIPNYELMTIYPYINPLSVRWGILALNGVTQRADLLNFQDVIDIASFDPYVFQRNAYLQHRNYTIAKNNDSESPHFSHEVLEPEYLR
jgi:phospholipid-binding lipoprotein MlaA